MPYGYCPTAPQDKFWDEVVPPHPTGTHKPSQYKRTWEELYLSVRGDERLSAGEEAMERHRQTMEESQMRRSWRVISSHEWSELRLKWLLSGRGRGLVGHLGRACENSDWLHRVTRLKDAVMGSVRHDRKGPISSRDDGQIEARLAIEKAGDERTEREREGHSKHWDGALVFLQAGREFLCGLCGVETNEAGGKTEGETLVP